MDSSVKGLSQFAEVPFEGSQFVTPKSVRFNQGGELLVSLHSLGPGGRLILTCLGQLINMQEYS